MTTKSLAGIITLAAAALTTAHAAFEITPGTDLFLTGTAGLKYDDNIFLAHSGEKSSAIFDIAPGISVEMGSAALTKNVFTYSEDFVTYTDASSQNTQLANVQYDGNYSDDKLTLKLDAGYHQLAQNTRDARLNGVIVHTDVANISPDAEVKVSPKTVLGAAFDYYNYHYTPAGFTDLQMWTVPLNAYYEIEPNLQASAGYRYRNNSLDLPAADSYDNYFNVGARGTFDPKLTGTVDIGYNQRVIKSVTVNGVHISGRTESSVGFDAKLQYAYDEKTAFNFVATNDFANAATGDSQKVFELSAGVTSAISEVLTADGTISYYNYKYVGTARHDDYYTGQIGLTYKFNQYLSGRASYLYQSNSSNFSVASFNDNVFAVSVTARY